jgi:uncharacterized protein YggE
MMKSSWLVLILAAAAAACADEVPRSVTVSGTGIAVVEADKATVSMSIVAREATVAAAQAIAAEVTTRVLELTDGLDIERGRVNTTGASVRPDYRWNRDKEEQELRGYIAERRMTVELLDLEKLGPLVEGAVAAGVNQVAPPRLDSSKRRDAYRDALRAAAEDAEANARVLASALRTGLGKAMQVNSSTVVPPPLRLQSGMMLREAADSAPAESYNAADLTFEATVNIVFALDD